MNTRIAASVFPAQAGSPFRRLAPDFAAAAGPIAVVPAQAGTHAASPEPHRVDYLSAPFSADWVPACAGTTARALLGGAPSSDVDAHHVVPAQAGTHAEFREPHRVDDLSVPSSSAWVPACAGTTVRALLGGAGTTGDGGR